MFKLIYNNLLNKSIFVSKNNLNVLKRSTVKCSTNSSAANKPVDENPATEEAKPKTTLIIDKDGPITLIGINRCDQKNAIDTETGLKLSEAISNFEDDPKSTVGILYGLGGTFCSGHDVNDLLEGKIRPELFTLSEGTVGPTRRYIRKPMICAINGYCVANGLELALMCDLRVMEENAILGFLNRRFGIPAMDGGTVRLPALIGLSRALDLILTGRSVEAKEAFEIGLVNRIVATGTSLGQSVNLAHCLAKFPQATLQHDRISTYNAVYDASSFDDAIQFEIMKTTKESFTEAMQGAAKFKEGIGRGGKSYNIRERVIADWELDEIIREGDEHKK